MLERAVSDPEWDPSGESIYYQRWDDFPDAEPATVLLQHPSNPFLGPLRDDLAFEVSLQAFAYDYLVAAQPRLQLPEWWLAALEQPRTEPDNPLFGWMPILWPLEEGEEEFFEPFGSFYAGDPATDSFSAVLFASDRIESQFLGSEFGLRIVIRLHKLPTGEVQASIGGVDASLPFGNYRGWARAATPEFETEADRLAILNSLLVQRRPSVAAAAGLDAGSIKIRSLRLGPLDEGDYQIEWRGIGSTNATQDVEGDEEDLSDALQFPYAFTVVGKLKGGETLLHRSPMVANAVGDARVFRRDRASCNPLASMADCRPTRSDGILDLARSVETITGVLNGPLSYPPFVVVRPCPQSVRADRPLPNAPLPITLPGVGPAVRSDNASAVQGFRHARELLDRLTAYSLSPSTYFKIAKPRLLIAYRSGIAPGPGRGGQTVNACVHPRGWPADMVGPTPLKKRPPLVLHLACANITRQARAPWVQGGPPSPKEPLGIGADARWIWHEFGHVLLMATTGELELRFAHSPGDALAAIVADPDAINAIRLDPSWRFATFPWVYLPRRHDRPVETGWSWSGTMHAELASVPPSLHPRRKGYQSEQILSSSLFRLYRCLGGDTVLDSNLNDHGLFERTRASHYAVYLVARALQILGDARIVPANNAGTFVQALLGADRTAGDWSATFPLGGAQTYDRTGGCAIKAIRWAFERQGMYPDPAAASGNEPGAPPDVDVYVDSRRPTQEATQYGIVHYGAGAYAPVSLHWQAAQANPVPLWQASSNAIHDLGAGQYEVEVGNRGRNPATGVSVELWWAPWPLGNPEPKWPNAATWTAAAPGPLGPQLIGPGLTAKFGPFTDPVAAGVRHILLAVAHCAGDPANIKTPGLPCATIPTRILDVVANDNNIGLLVVW